MTTPRARLIARAVEIGRGEQRPPEEASAALFRVLTGTGYYTDNRRELVTYWESLTDDQRQSIKRAVARGLE